MNFTDTKTLIYIIAAVFILLLFMILIIRFIKKTNKPFDYNELEGHDFEKFCADLLAQNGFVDIQVTKKSGDFGADILAEKDMVTYAIQCKVYSSAVGVKAVTEAHAGRDFYDRMVGAVMTNQRFTQPAKEAAKKLKILLWDGDYIRDLIDQSSDENCRK